MFAVRIIQKFSENSGTCEAELMKCDCFTLLSLNTPKDHISFIAQKLRINEMLSYYIGLIRLEIENSVISSRAVQAPINSPSSVLPVQTRGSASLPMKNRTVFPS